MLGRTSSGGPSGGSNYPSGGGAGGAASAAPAPNNRPAGYITITIVPLDYVPGYSVHEPPSSYFRSDIDTLDTVKTKFIGYLNGRGLYPPLRHVELRKYGAFENLEGNHKLLDYGINKDTTLYCRFETSFSGSMKKLRRSKKRSQRKTIQRKTRRNQKNESP